MIGGYIVRAASEHIRCADCIAVLQRSKSSAPEHGFIAHQDRGGLFYPTQELVKLLIGLRRFVDCVLPDRRSVAKPLELCVQRIGRELVCPPVLTCGNADANQSRELLLLITWKFIRPFSFKFSSRSDRQECCRQAA
ncbi:hypothetical protein HPB49_006958 [Dermacentor silvarum]|uniref:Uncharacterized protein n=1 Tax=Dermacentor silvarum TaxID=543639 RepID=A0ACB8D335_DERSI|nr:hypothetical protein HPB49_006958 [Dermacentor silvarum]